MVLQADSRVRRRGSKRDHTGKVVPTAEEVELDAGEDGKEGEGVDEREGPCNS